MDSLGKGGSGRGVGFAGEGTEKQTREEQGPARCEGLRRSLLTDWMSLPVTSVQQAITHRINDQSAEGLPNCLRI